MPLRFTLPLLGAALTGLASAQTLIPLDSRPATRVLPALIASLAGGSPQVPQAALLGDAKRGADPEALMSWLNSRPASSDPLIVALDALAYGGLVQSRTSELTAAQAVARLEPLRAWQARTGQPVYAFITLPREPDATNRARNLEVVRTMLEWARAGVFKELHVTWDDALANSPAVREGAALQRQAPENVRIYPGADEVLSMLTARALTRQEATVRVEYSVPQAARQVIRYEGITLTQSAENHAKASGFQVVEGPADLTLYVFNGGDPRRAAVRISTLLRQGPIAVADVEKVNLGNTRLWRDLQTLRQHANLRALAAWGTPGNNLGSALAHARVSLGPVDPVRQDALLAREFANDVIYSSRVRAALRASLPEDQLNTAAGQATLLRLAQEYFPLRVGQEYTLKDAALPWGRSYEWDFNLQPR
ncbi:DUF4127 domain-containing protein [Deinococcus deserti]|uniref:DUF4127 family protein n=1 Tax=Deinococcus deserti (strain DSM 17065 / CIP 109153 / LMG 22923 / VCD115) TaxID=546414 RepID=C1CVQ0_DEIDV|nr:DUF4127 family protein [Deinococcus deserti]ACO46267.1 Conserved hypothetical protein, precursor [Deinococcus deserti VCD115]